MIWFSAKRGRRDLYLGREYIEKWIKRLRDIGRGKKWNANAMSLGKGGGDVRTCVGNNMEICYRETGDNLRLVPRANFVPPRRGLWISMESQILTSTETKNRASCVFFSRRVERIFSPPFILSFIRSHFAFFRLKKKERGQDSFSFEEEEEEKEEEPIQLRQVKFGGTNERDAFVRSRHDDAR